MYDIALAKYRCINDSCWHSRILTLAYYQCHGMVDMLVLDWLNQVGKFIALKLGPLIKILFTLKCFKRVESRDFGTSGIGSTDSPSLCKLQQIYVLLYLQATLQDLHLKMKVPLNWHALNFGMLPVAQGERTLLHA